MKLARLVTAALGALTVAAVVANPAFAVEGPFYSVKGARLTNGVNKGIQMVDTSEFKLKSTFGGVGFTILCKDVRAATGAEVFGSTGANAGGGEATLKFSECTILGFGVGCKIIGGAFETKKLKITLAYSEAERKGKIQARFSPKEGTEFAHIGFESGSGCSMTGGSTNLVGSVVTELLNEAKAVEVGKEPAEKLIIESHFPVPAISKVWTESGGALTNVSISMEFLAKPATIEGEAEMVANPLEVWGVFT